MTIDFEKDQQEVLDKTTNVNKLADKIREMQAVQKAIEMDEEQIKQKKKHNIKKIWSVIDEICVALKTLIGKRANINVIQIVSSFSANNFNIL